jgi:hypothetical protein
MTLPAVDPQVRSLSGPEYTVGPRCSHCGKFAEHAHHIFRRSRQGGPEDWVEIEGKIVGNKTALCWDCHNLVTGGPGGHRAAIRYDQGLFVWCEVLTDEHSVVAGYAPERPLAPQPPTPESLATSSRDSGNSGSSDACPFCGQAKRRRPASSGGFGRRRKTYTIKVPDDAEDGAEVLDTLVDDLGLVLGVEPDGSGRYYVIVPALYYAHQEKARFIESLAGRGG